MKLREQRVSNLRHVTSRVFESCAMVTIVEEEQKPRVPQRNHKKQQASNSHAESVPTKSFDSEAASSSREREADREGDGWETASEGEDDNDRVAAPSTADDQFEDALTEEQQRQRILAQVNAVKAAGNAEYAEGRFPQALSAYASALDLLTDNADANDVRAMCLCNRAMCYLQMGEFEEAVNESSKAIDLNPTYVKAFLRRAQAHEKVDKLEEALADMKKVLELDPGNKEARKAVERLEPIVAERREKLKEEMLGKLKDLGNSILGRFGMSVDNFKAVQDPETGSYSLSYQQ